jgi:hypothetical protein
MTPTESGNVLMLLNEIDRSGRIFQEHRHEEEEEWLGRLVIDVPIPATCPILSY